MPSAGDRVIFEGVKVGGGRREGELLEVSGRAVRVRWPDGSETLMFPGPGSMRVIGRASGAAKKAGAAAPAGGAKRAAAGAPAGGAKRAAAAARKKAAPVAAKKRAKKKR